MPVIYLTDHFPLGLPDGHRFPAAKHALLAQAVRAFAGEDCHPAPAATRADLLLAHAACYVDAVLEGRLTTAQEKVIGLPWSAALRDRALHAAGATTAAARSALLDGCGITLAGGAHHAGPDGGAGFCVFNDVAVAIRVLQTEGAIRRALIIDLDVHRGDGTAAIFAHDPSVLAFSMHGARNYPFAHPEGPHDIALPDGCTDDAYLSALAQHVPPLFGRHRPDIVCYLAGADPYAGDRLGRLALSRQGLLARDRLVYECCLQHGIGMMLCMAGGYAEPLADTVDIHTASVRLACSLWSDR